MLSAAKDVRSGVLEFVQAVRSAASNPYDFLSQQTVDNRFKYLVTVVKNVVSAMESVEIEVYYFVLFKRKEKWPKQKKNHFVFYLISR